MEDRDRVRVDMSDLRVASRLPSQFNTELCIVLTMGCWSRLQNISIA